jgi:hypothetical protein
MHVRIRCILSKLFAHSVVVEMAIVLEIIVDITSYEYKYSEYHLVAH